MIVVGLFGFGGLFLGGAVGGCGEGTEEEIADDANDDPDDLDDLDDGAEESVPVTLSPTDAATNIALNATVTAQFGGPMTEPADWGAVFTLKKDGAGDSLCTAVSYDSVQGMATCAHPELDGDSRYTAAISGLSGVTDTTATFTTGSEIAGTMARSSVASNSAGNDVTLTFTFASAVPAGWTPAISVTDPDGAGLTVSGCDFDVDRTSYSCTVSGIDGCTTFSDYTVTATGTGEFTTAFNSADDEFETDAPLTHNCWTRSFAQNGTFSITDDGNLRFVVTVGEAGGTVEDSVYKDFSGETDIAVLTHISSITRPSGGDSGIKVGINQFSGNYERALTFWVGSSGGYDRWQFALSRDAYISTEPSVGGELGASYTSDGPFYVCMVRYNNTAKAYLSTDGSNYIRLSADNMTCYGACDLTDVVEAAVDWASFLVLHSSNSVANSTLSGEYGYARFKMTGITGESSADCPPL